jgi:hypothetical protein
MKVTYTLDNGLTVELEGKTQTDIWDQLAEFQEVFGNTTCVAKIKGQVVKSDKVKFVKRTVDDNDYYELLCVDGESPLFMYKKSFGQHKKGGTLFPKRDVPEGCIPGLNGWHKYVKSNDSATKQVESNNNQVSSDEVPF